MVCTAGTKLIPIIQHTDSTAFVARVWTAQWRQPFLSLCVWRARVLHNTRTKSGSFCGARSLSQARGGNKPCEFI